MKQIVILFLLAFSASVYAQDFAVQSFKALPLDQTARIEQRIDRNGNIAASIRIKTIIHGFSFEEDYWGGIVHIKQEKGEVIVWVPSHSRALTIIHPQFGVLDYRYPIEIVEGRTYELVLTFHLAFYGPIVDYNDNSFEHSRNVLVYDKEGNQYTTGLFITTAKGAWVRIQTDQSNYEQYFLIESDKEDFTYMTIGKSEIEPLYVK